VATDLIKNFEVGNNLPRNHLTSVGTGGDAFVRIIVVHPKTHNVIFHSFKLGEQNPRFAVVPQNFVPPGDIHVPERPST
jgi:hypothetical protein